MPLVSGMVWILAGVVMALIVLAVSPADRAPSPGRTLLSGVSGGFAGGLVIELLARRTLSGFATGVIGSVLGSTILLVVWTLLAHPAHREA